MILFWLLTACQSDYDVKEGAPQLEIGASTVNFETVVVYQQSIAALSIANTGMAPLEINGTPFVDPNPAFQVTQVPQTVGADQTAVIELRYAPTEVGEHDAELQLLTNDPQRPLVSINLIGEGVHPLIEVDPLDIDFGTVSMGEQRSASVFVQAGGSGILGISDLYTSSSEFMVSLPPGFDLPVALSPGLGLELEVFFTASDDAPVTGSLTIESNDPTASEVHVSLGANGGGTGDNLPPTVVITSPPAGWQTPVHTSIPIQATISDDQDEPDLIPVLIYWDTVPVTTVFANPNGDLSIDASLPTAAMGPLTLRAIDSGGAIGEDSVTLNVVDPNEPMPYIISGGVGIHHFWTVDDDVEIYVDDQLVFRDNNGTQDDHPPVSFMAQNGSTIRVVAIDNNYCDQALDTLLLHFGVGQSQTLFEGVCRSACEESPCYDSSFSGPWPSTFLDEEFQVALPSQ
ncbi:MAG: choice-of-anchor D domain-containing protein [Myxococcota bacterium]